MKSNSKLLYTFCCHQCRYSRYSRWWWFMNVCGHTGRTGLQNNAVYLLVIHALQTGKWQFVNWFSLKTLLWKLSVHRGRHSGSGLDRRSKGKSFPVLARTQQDAQHKSPDSSLFSITRVTKAPNILSVLFLSSPISPQLHFWAFSS